MNTKRNLSPQTQSILLKMQINEITEYYIYTAIAKTVKDEHNRQILERIGREEKAHAEIWQKISGQQGKPKQAKILWYKILNRIFGFTFTLKLMEKAEEKATAGYELLMQEVPEALQISRDEERHEEELLALLDEERLQYVGSMVLGLSDALVELTGTLAGLTFALQNNRLVALSGLITGISATLSMTSSEYLSARSDGHPNPLKSSLYTGSIYLITVLLLVLPYLFTPVDAYVQALAILLGTVILIIFVFTYYISVAKDLSFKRRFLEMAGISLSVAAISFIIGIIVKKFLGLDL